MKWILGADWRMDARVHDKRRAKKRQAKRQSSKESVELRIKKTTGRKGGDLARKCLEEIKKRIKSNKKIRVRR